MTTWSSCTACPCPPCRRCELHDLVIRGGTVVDGTGRQRYRADVAVDDGRITAVGEVDGSGRRQLDADGLIVAPGFVDIHTHYDGQVSWDPLMTPSSWHGVTTVVMGNCGVGFAPADPARHDWLISLMEGVEDIPGTALAEGITWGWESFPEYLDTIDTGGRAIDVAAQLPHGALRAYVMGERGADHEEAPTAEEIAVMRRLVREAIEAGALGFTSSRTRNHRTRDGALTPSLTAGSGELLGIATGLGDAGAGVFEFVADFRDVDGVPMRAQVPARAIGLLFGLEGSLHPFLTRPTYRRLADLALADRVAALREPAVKAAILAERPEGRGMFGAVGAPFDRMFELGDPPDYEPAPESSVAARAAAMGRDAEDLAYDLLLGDDGHALLYYPALNYAEGNLDVAYQMLTHPLTVPGLSDGGAHCGVICDGSFPTYLVTHWTRDRARGERLSLEWVVKAQAHDTAALVGLNDRGVVAEGMKADLNLIDVDRLTIRAPRIVHDLPAGGRRLVQRAEGYVATVVAGEVVLAEGQPTGALPGQLVRGAQPAPV